MPDGYTHVSLRNVRTCRDGSLVRTTGRYRRFLNRTELADREHIIELIGEPFDFAPIHDTAIEVWGQVWLGPHPYLRLHDAKPLESDRQPPVPVRPPLPGEVAHFLARVTTVGGVHLATTPQRHTFVLSGALPAAGIHELTGYVLSLTPPLFQVTAARPAAASAAPGGPECEKP